MSTLTEKISNASRLVRQAVGSALSSVHAGDEKLANRNNNSAGVSSLGLGSSAFADGSPIPHKNTPQGENVSPELSWTGVPAATRELVLIVEDPDAPFSKPFVHWILHRLPPHFTTLPAGLAGEPELSQLGGALQGMNDAKTRGYFGPKPPLGHGVHHYHFQLFALDIQLNLGPDATLDELKKAMQGHVLADGEIIGTYERTAHTD
jgi:Raf kinase inhibitor-like YbhB/YbcL family protein